MLRGAAIDAQDFRYLRPLGPRTGADLERRARRDTAVPAAFNHTRVQEGITGPIGKLYETEPLVGVIPFDDRLDRGTGGSFKSLGAGSRCRSEAAPGCFEVVVVEATAAGRTKISISAAHWSSWVEWNTPTLK